MKVTANSQWKNCTLRTTQILVLTSGSCFECNKIYLIACHKTEVWAFDAALNNHSDNKAIKKTWIKKLSLSRFGGSCHKRTSSSSTSNCRICLVHYRNLTFSYISVLVFSLLLSINCLLSLLLLWSNSWILSNLEILPFLYAISFFPLVFFYDGCILFFIYRLYFPNSLPLKIQFVILKWYSKCQIVRTNSEKK